MCAVAKWAVVTICSHCNPDVTKGASACWLQVPASSSFIASLPVSAYCYLTTPAISPPSPEQRMCVSDGVPAGLRRWRSDFTMLPDLLPSPRFPASLVFRNTLLSLSPLNPALGFTFAHSKAGTLSSPSHPLGLQNLDGGHSIWGATTYFYDYILLLWLNYATLLPSR